MIYKHWMKNGSYQFMVVFKNKKKGKEIATGDCQPINRELIIELENHH